MLDSHAMYSQSDSEEVEDEDLDSEEVVKQVRRLYTTKEVGLRDAAKSIPGKGLKIVAPRQKITVLLVGSHQLGKEQFLRVYFDENRHNEFFSKVKYDNMDRIYITNGYKKKVLTGEVVLDYCPHLAKLGQVPGLKNFLTTEISMGKTKSFVSFILAPEKMPEQLDENSNSVVRENYPFDIDKAMDTLAEAADLIFVFFDPTGAVSPKTTLAPFANIWERYSSKFHLLLAKASDTECSDLMREEVLTQIVHEIWRHPVSLSLGYIPMIYCPDLTTKVREDETLCRLIQSTVDMSAVKALEQLEQDAELLLAKLNKIKIENETAKATVSTPSNCFTWLILISMVVFAVALVRINNHICYKKILLDYNSVWEAFDEDRGIYLGLFIFPLIVLYKLSHCQFTEILLSPEEEEILDKRINFAHYALYQRDKMQYHYADSVLLSGKIV